LRAFRAPTLTELHERLCHTIIHSPEDKLDVISSVDVQIHNVIAEAESMAWEFDLKHLWLTPARWTYMINQYIDANEFRVWLEKCATKIGSRGRGIGLMRTKTVAARGGEATGHTNKETRRWGSCMLGVSYKARPRPQITLYSRTSYLGYLSALDLSVAWMCGRYLAAATNQRIEDISFVWMNEALQYHNFKSLAYLLNHTNPQDRDHYRAMMLSPRLTDELRDEMRRSPALLLTRKWMVNMLKLDASGATLGDMSYNTYRRIRRRYHTEVLGYEKAQEFEGWSLYKQGEKKGEKKEFFKAYKPLPSTPISGLDFRKLGLPLAGVTPLHYDDAEEDYDDTEEDDD
jgi:hypothetical protein